MIAQKINTIGATINIICWKRSRSGIPVDIRCSKPCLECAIQMRKHGIKCVKYSMQGEILDIPMKIETIAELFADIKNIHISRSMRIAIAGNLGRTLADDVWKILNEELGYQQAII